MQAESTAKLAKIGIVGGGVVGRATALAFMGFAEVKVYDKRASRSTSEPEVRRDGRVVRPTELRDVLAQDLIFVCLPTPSKEDGSGLNLDALVEFFESEEAQADKEKVLVIKSTVPVGLTRRTRDRFGFKNLIHSPEFLTSRTAVFDASLPSHLVIGGEECWGKAELAMLYRKRFPGVPLFLMTSEESELVKLITNAFYAVKVAFFNESRQLIDKTVPSDGGSRPDWQEVITAVLGCGKIHPSHTKVPGPDGQYGFGGACLPKDALQFSKCCASLMLDATVTNAALMRNERDRLGTGITVPELQAAIDRAAATKCFMPYSQKGSTGEKVDHGK